MSIYWPLLQRDAIMKLEADMNGFPRDRAWPTGGDDFPHKAHETRSFPKRTALSEAQNHRCAYCGVIFSDDPQSRDYGTIDHFVPKVAGGPCHWSNEVMACNLCNQGRGAMYAERYFRTVQWKGRERAFRWGARQQSRAALRRIAKGAEGKS